MNPKSKYTTEQEEFWAGEFGSDYIERNQGDALLASNLNFFSQALHNAQGIRSCLEFGANIGMNLKALKLLYPTIEAHGVDINRDAVDHLKEVVPVSNAHHGSILDFSLDRTWDLSLIKGVLIHVNPEVLPKVYDRLVTATSRYLLVAEYYNPSPVAITYRGHENRLFKRDFAGELMDLYPELHLVDYGFNYRRDPNFPQDDITWFLLKKTD
jgi:pseudaminic acid biosynthesis-associated methylase